MNGKDINNKFEEIYSSKIIPQLNNLESYRLNKVKVFTFVEILLIISVLFLIISVAVIFIMKDNCPSNIIFTIPLAFILILIFGLIRQKLDNTYRKKAKKLLLPPILSLFGKFRLLDKGNISLKEIKSLGLYPMADTKKDDDVIVGTYKDIPITLMETEISQNVKSETRLNGHVISDNQSNDKNFFNGLILKIKTKDVFSCSVVAQNIITVTNFKNLLREISKKDSSLCPPKILSILDNPMFDFFEQAQQFMRENKLYLQDGKIYIDIFNAREKNKVTKKLEEVKLEDTDFNKLYKIYTDDQVEARCILTPSLMEKIKNIQAVFLCLSLDFVFKGDEIYFFLGHCLNLDNKDTNNEHGFFEVSSIKSTVLDKSKYQSIFKELVTIFSLISYFQLNNKVEP